LSVRLRSVFAAGFGAALCLTSGAALAAPQTPPTEVDSLTVFASTDVRLTVALGGDIAPDQMVVSAPVGIRCSGALFDYINSETRQCWLWVRRNQPVMLTAQGRGVYGRDWSVVWSGCEPVAGGPACTFTPAGEAVVAAVFSGATR
jgi:hypothetical protein